MRRLFIYPVFVLLLFSFESFGQNLFEQADLPIRTTRRFGISLDMGWNSLVGVGPTLQYYASPHWGVDAGLGLSSVGWKLSARGRYLFLESNFTPFVGAGIIYGTGSSAVIENEFNGNKISFLLKPAPFIQLIVGGDLVTKGGFFLMFDLGYAILLSENVSITNGIPNSDQKLAMDVAYGSGIVIEVGIGYVFKNKR